MFAFPSFSSFFGQAISGKDRWLEETSR